MFASATRGDVKIYGSRASLERIGKFVVLKFLIQNETLTLTLTCLAQNMLYNAIFLAWATVAK